VRSNRRSQCTVDRICVGECCARVDEWAMHYEGAGTVVTCNGGGGVDLNVGEAVEVVLRRRNRNFQHANNEMA
jgi:hypothetical protein